jgi:hypothetical protein
LLLFCRAPTLFMMISSIIMGCDMGVVVLVWKPCLRLKYL